MAYVFYESDNRGNEIPFKDENFKLLANICFRNCAYFSLVIQSEKVLVKTRKLSAYMVEERLLLPPHISEFSEQTPLCIQFFRACDDSKKELIKISRNLWKFVYYWGNKNPEDLTFYREDASVFFRSIVHEGEAIISPREGEDVTQILNQISYRQIVDWKINAGIIGLNNVDV